MPTVQNAPTPGENPFSCSRCKKPMSQEEMMLIGSYGVLHFHYGCIQETDTIKSLKASHVNP